MVDFTKCSGRECPFKERCVRYTSVPGGYQSYFVNAPYDKEKKDCDHFWGPEHYKKLAVRKESA